MQDLLKDLTILDFSHRLPGPLGCNILGHLGAKVYKIEDETFQDAFLSGLFNSFDPSFVDWYHDLNDQKELIRFDFKNEKTSEKLHELVKKADGILMALPPKVRVNLKLTDEDLKKINPNIAVIEMGSSTQHKMSMHDLNAMAETGILSLYLHDKNEKVVHPPFLPISGMLFGQQIATQLMGAIAIAKMKNEFVHTTAYLFDTAQMMCQPMWPQKQREIKNVKFLHNGAFPCYCMYRTKDGHYAGVAAVEEKFWREFEDIFDIPLKCEQRFDTNEESFNKIAEAIGKFTLKEISEKIEGKDICVSLIEKI